MKSMLPRALVADLFGTLVPKWSSSLSSEAKRKMAARAGIDPDVFYHAWQARWWERELGKMTAEESIADILEKFAPGADESLAATILEIWTDYVRRALQPRPEALRALETLRAAGLRVGLLSNAGPTVPLLFASTPLATVVDCAVFSCGIGVAKPDARIYSVVCSQLGVAPSECVYVGDGGDEELQGAQSAGMAPVFLRVEAEIEQEGLPDGAAAWRGPVIQSFDEIHRHVDARA